MPQLTVLHELVRDHEPDPDKCFGCKAAGLRFSLSADFRATGMKEKRLERDLDAYSRLRGEGLRPAAVDGAADVEKRAEHPLDVNMSDSPFVKRMNARQKDETAAALGGAA